jgi:hypothetical protein
MTETSHGQPPTNRDATEQKGRVRVTTAAEKFEENEERRLDLAEREIVVREEALKMELDRVAKDTAGVAEHRATLEEQNERRIAMERDHQKRVMEHLERHDELLARIATALEAIAKGKGAL